MRPRRRDRQPDKPPTQRLAQSRQAQQAQQAPPGFVFWVRMVDKGCPGRPGPIRAVRHPSSASAKGGSLPKREEQSQDPSPRVRLQGGASFGEARSRWSRGQPPNESSGQRNLSSACFCWYHECARDPLAKIARGHPNHAPPSHPKDKACSWLAGRFSLFYCGAQRNGPRYLRNRRE